MKEKSQQIYWINSLKAIGMILVIIGHNDTMFTQYIYSFHMPLFFFISGLLFNDVKWSNGREFIKSRIRSLIIPYFILSIILYIIWIPLDIFQGKVITKTIMFKNFIGIFYSQGGHEFMTWGLPMWFVTCLFVVSVMFFFINKYLKKYLKVSLILCLLVGYLFSFLKFNLPWSFNIAFIAVVFYGIGYLSKRLISNYKINIKIICLILILGVTSLVLSIINGRVDMYSNSYNNYLLFFITSLCGVFFIVLLVKALPENKVLNFIGISTLPILAFHIRSLEVIKFVVMKVLHLNLNFNGLLLGGIILPIVQVIVIIPIVLVTNKFLKAVSRR